LRFPIIAIGKPYHSVAIQLSMMGNPVAVPILARESSQGLTPLCVDHLAPGRVRCGFRAAMTGARGVTHRTGQH
jgi:hypothetical protein